MESSIEKYLDMYGIGMPFRVCMKDPRSHERLKVSASWEDGQEHGLVYCSGFQLAFSKSYPDSWTKVSNPRTGT